MEDTSNINVSSQNIMATNANDDQLPVPFKTSSTTTTSTIDNFDFTDLGHSTMKRNYTAEDQTFPAAPGSPSNISESTATSGEDTDTMWPSNSNPSTAPAPALKKRASPIPMLKQSDLTSNTVAASTGPPMARSNSGLSRSNSIRRPQRLSSSSSLGSSTQRISFCDEISRTFSNEQEDILEGSDDAGSCASDTLLEISNWKVLPSAITQVPLIYPLSLSSGFVENCSSLKVSARISHCLTTRSIAAMYDDDRGSAMATTDEGLGFAMRLFHGSGSYSTGIIVEVQHQQGDAMQFHFLCQMLFEAAKGEPYSRRSKNATEQVRAPPATLLKGRHFDDQHDQVKNSLEKADELLGKDRIDAKRLGMEMLIFLTDPVQEDTSQQDEHTLYAAETIILGRDAVGLSIHEKLFDLLQKSHRVGSSTSGADGGNSSDEEYDEQDEITLLRPVALKVMRNSLGVLSKSTDIKEVVSEKAVPEWLVESLVPSLVNEIKSAHMYPGDAYVAAECLIALFELSDKAKIKAVDLKALPLLESAHKYGTKYHALLGRATQVGVAELKLFQSLKTEQD